MSMTLADIKDAGVKMTDTEMCENSVAWYPGSGAKYDQNVDRSVELRNKLYTQNNIVAGFQDLKPLAEVVDSHNPDYCDLTGIWNYIAPSDPAEAGRLLHDMAHHIAPFTQRLAEGSANDSLSEAEADSLRAYVGAVELWIHHALGAWYDRNNAWSRTGIDQWVVDATVAAYRPDPNDTVGTEARAAVLARAVGTMMLTWGCTTWETGWCPLVPRSIIHTGVFDKLDLSKATGPTSAKMMLMGHNTARYVRAMENDGRNPYDMPTPGDYIDLVYGSQQAVYDEAKLTREVWRDTFGPYVPLGSPVWVGIHAAVLGDLDVNTWELNP